VDTVDVVVVGGGFGGLGAALGAVEAGARVVLLERVGYLGGCAATFERGGARYEAGATMTAGLGDDQLLGRIVARWNLDVALDPVSPAMTLRWGEAPLEVPVDRGTFVDQLCGLPGAPVAALRSALAEQGARADALWGLLDDPTLLAPGSAGAWARLVARSPGFAPLAPWVGRPLRDWLGARGLLGFAPLVRYAEALCQLTVQVGIAEAETPFALAALDFPFRGLRHVRGGIGALTAALGAAIGDVRLHTRCTGLEREGGAWIAHTRHGPVRAPVVIADLAPHALRALLGRSTPRLDALAARVETGWGAVVSYRRIADGALPDGAFHLDLVADPARPCTDGNHVLVSVSEARPGERTATCSTHVRPGDDPRGVAERASAALEATLRLRAPEIAEATRSSFPASPRTFARFTGRPGGWVGGVPRRAGLGAYRGLWPRPLLPGLWPVGDAVLLGQSTLATFAGGLRTAAAVR
jgi:phytoene dehydrogenase-like protein